MTADLRFEIDWEQAPNVRTPELRATWARLEIWIGDECLTQVEDVATGSVRRSVYCSLYPLAEWISYNWWFLRGDSRPAVVPQHAWSHSRLSGRDAGAYRWLDRHNFRSAGEGFAWPDLTLVPEGNVVRSVWKRDRRAPDSRLVRFLSEGEQYLRTAETELVLANLVNQTATRLAEAGLASSALDQEWESVMNADPGEVEFCLAAARLGLDPYDDAHGVENEVLRAASDLPPSLLDDFLNAVEPAKIGESIDWVNSAWRKVEKSVQPTEWLALCELVGDIDQLAGNSVSRFPWETGWAEARLVRNVLCLSPVDRFDPSVYVPVRASTSPDRSLQAVGGRAESQSALLVLGGPVSAQARRFSQGRGLWHLLFDRTPTGRFLLTPACTDRQRTERAFAAELLAPADGILNQLPVDPVGATSEDLDLVAAHFGVSPLLVRHQLENQLLRL